MKIILLVFCLFGTTIAFADNERGERRINACSNSGEDVAICTAKILNKKLNRVLNKLNRGSESSSPLRSCSIEFCTYQGNLADPEENVRCLSGSRGEYKQKFIEARNETHARHLFYQSLEGVDTEGDGIDSINSVKCD